MTDSATPASGTGLDRSLERLLPRVTPRIRDLIGFVLVIGLVQAAFWGLYGSPLWPKPSAQQVDRIAFTDTTLARLPKPTVLAAAQARYEPVELPHTECCDPTYLALKLRFDLPSVPAEGLGLAAYQQVDNFIILATQVSTIAAQDLLWGGAFFAYPDLKVAWSEAGIGWISFYLDRCDRHYRNQIWLGHDFGDKLPSDIFRDHSLACFVSDLRARSVTTSFLSAKLRPAESAEEDTPVWVDFGLGDQTSERMVGGADTYRSRVLVDAVVRGDPWSADLAMRRAVMRSLFGAVMSAFGLGLAFYFAA